jgi:hypothetical protein
MATIVQEFAIVMCKKKLKRLLRKINIVGNVISKSAHKAK